VSDILRLGSRVKVTDDHPEPLIWDYEATIVGNRDAKEQNRYMIAVDHTGPLDKFLYACLADHFIVLWRAGRSKSILSEDLEF